MTANIETLLGEVQARMNAIDSSSPKLTLPELRAAASMLEENGLAVDDAAFDNVLAGKLSAVDGQTELLDLLYLAKSLRPVKEKTESNPVGSVMPIASLDNQVTTESGEVWLRSGLIEDDPSKFNSIVGVPDSLRYKGSINLRPYYASVWRGVEEVGGFIYCLAGDNQIYKFTAGREFVGIVAFLSEVATPGDLCFSPTENKWYVPDQSTDDVAIYDINFNYISQGIIEQAGESLTLYGICTDGTVFYVLCGGAQDEIRKYSSAFELLESQSYLTVNTDIRAIGYYDNHFYMFGNTGDSLYKTTMDLTVVDSVFCTAASNSSTGITVSGAGIRMLSDRKTMLSYDLDLKGHHCLERQNSAFYARGMCEYNGHYYTVNSNKTVRKLTKDGVLVQSIPLPVEVLTAYDIVINSRGVFILSNARLIYELDSSFVYVTSRNLGAIVSTTPTESLQEKEGNFYITSPINSTATPVYIYSATTFSYVGIMGGSNYYTTIKGFDFYKGGIVYSGYSASKYWVVFADTTAGASRLLAVDVSSSAGSFSHSLEGLFVADDNTIMMIDNGDKVPFITEVQSVAGLTGERTHSESGSKYYVRIK